MNPLGDTVNDWLGERSLTSGFEEQSDLDDIGEVTCSCDGTEPHKNDCDVWTSDGYYAGRLDWDEVLLVLVPAKRSLSSLSSGNSLSGFMQMKCRHYQQPVTMPGGTVVYASSSHHDRKGAPVPDLGIYLDGVWEPDTRAYLIGCPDYGTPIPSVDNVLRIVLEGLQLAREGKRVEVGCIGGHGRTGMLLSIMAVLCMDKPDGPAAVAHIRKVYCDNAVESAKQEWYVDGIAADIQGQPWPLPPTPKPAVITSTPTLSPAKPAGTKTSTVKAVKETKPTKTVKHRLGRHKNKGATKQ